MSFLSLSLSQESVRRILIHSHTFSLSKFVLPIFLLLVALLSLSTLLNFFTTYLPPCVSFINVKVFLVPVLSFLLHLLPFPSIYYTHNFSLSNTHTHPCTFFFPTDIPTSTPSVCFTNVKLYVTESLSRSLSLSVCLSHKPRH